MDPNLRQPYNIFPAIRRLKAESATLAPEERRRLMATIALNAADRRAVALTVDISGDDFANLYPRNPEPAKITTDDAIDTFLDRFGNSSPEENALLERLIFNPVPDYATVLAEQEEANPAKPEADHGTSDQPVSPASDNDLGTLASIATAINSPVNVPAEPIDTPVAEPILPPAPAQQQSKPKTQRPRPAEQGLSLELAKIFIKQRQFDRAHEIISKISLNNPEKSVYFANQLRFLEKLIRIQRLQDAARQENS